MVHSTVLVLNRSWVAVNISNVRRAVTLLYQGYAKVVSPDDYATYDFSSWIERSRGANGRCIHTVAFRVMIPEVILLSFFNGGYRKRVGFSRRSIFERDENTCQYCGKRLPQSDLTIDHVVPRSRGGTESWKNLVVACVDCNVEKGQRLPHEAGMKLLRRPKRPDWIPILGAHTRSLPPESWLKFLDPANWDFQLKA